jgi:hypothetical protein
MADRGVTELTGCSFFACVGVVLVDQRRPVIPDRCKRSLDLCLSALGYSSAELDLQRRKRSLLVLHSSAEIKEMIVGRDAIRAVGYRALACVGASSEVGCSSLEETPAENPHRGDNQQHHDKRSHCADEFACVPHQSPRSASEIMRSTTCCTVMASL